MDRFLPFAGKAGVGGGSTFGQESAPMVPFKSAMSAATFTLGMAWDRELVVEIRP